MEKWYFHKKYFAGNDILWQRSPLMLASRIFNKNINGFCVNAAFMAFVADHIDVITIVKTFLCWIWFILKHFSLNIFQQKGFLPSIKCLFSSLIQKIEFSVNFREYLTEYVRIRSTCYSIAFFEKIHILMRTCLNSINELINVRTVFQDTIIIYRIGKCY